MYLWISNTNLDICLNSKELYGWNQKTLSQRLFQSSGSVCAIYHWVSHRDVWNRHIRRQEMQLGFPLFRRIYIVEKRPSKEARGCWRYHILSSQSSQVRKYCKLPATWCHFGYICNSVLCDGAPSFNHVPPNSRQSVTGEQKSLLLTSIYLRYMRWDLGSWRPICTFPILPRGRSQMNRIIVSWFEIR